MNEELASRLKRQEFQRMMAQKMGLVDNTIDPNKNRVMDPRLIHRDEKGVKPSEQPKK
jgi:hypothetical protein